MAEVTGADRQGFPLLERDGVLTSLADHLSWAAPGAGQLVLLHGEAGVGKSAVLSRFVSQARAVADVHIGWCSVEYATTVGSVDGYRPGSGYSGSAENIGQIVVVVEHVLARAQDHDEAEDTEPRRRITPAR
jgi:hypothetical protein